MELQTSSEQLEFVEQNTQGRLVFWCQCPNCGDRMLISTGLSSEVCHCGLRWFLPDFAAVAIQEKSHAG